MSEIDTYLEEKAQQKELEKLLAWRGFYLQDKISWDNLQLAIKQKEQGLKDKIDIPIANTFAAIRVNYKIDRLL